ncbi:hypothetical protein N7457_005382 [Penicillium paradoxum]|uniref:uncharacterized protein n=1 Tax=Penicillium paradoxum TaxID=176176 RepID=UPI0025488FF0|nr:uncharacterized protein N7457_005382 [Penicillium paradoxum]KAJ5780222.1 hypothetical protein N7457_005382 [Penicillium paradoxum]
MLLYISAGDLVDSALFTSRIWLRFLSNWWNVLSVVPLVLSGMKTASSLQKMASTFKDIASVIAKEAHSLGYIDSPNAVRSMNLDEANKVIPGGNAFLSTNGQGPALWARKLLGWQPDGAIPFEKRNQFGIQSLLKRHSCENYQKNFIMSKR